MSSSSICKEITNYIFEFYNPGIFKEVFIITLIITYAFWNKDSKAIK